MTVKTTALAIIASVAMIIGVRSATVAFTSWADAKKARIAVLEASAAASEERADREHALALKAIERASKAEAKASALETANRARRVVVAAAVETAPDTCKSYIGIVFAFADSLRVEADAWKETASEKGAAVNALTAEVIDLRSALSDTKEAKEEVESLYKPSFWSKIKPGLGFGLAFGIDPTTMEFEKVIGITLDWDF